MRYCGIVQYLIFLYNIIQSVSTSGMVTTERIVETDAIRQAVF